MTPGLVTPMPGPMLPVSYIWIRYRDAAATMPPACHIVLLCAAGSPGISRQTGVGRDQRIDDGRVVQDAMQISAPAAVIQKITIPRPRDPLAGPRNKMIHGLSSPNALVSPMCIS